MRAIALSAVLLVAACGGGGGAEMTGGTGGDGSGGTGGPVRGGGGIGAVTGGSGGATGGTGGSTGGTGGATGGAGGSSASTGGTGGAGTGGTGGTGGVMGDPTQGVVLAGKLYYVRTDAASWSSAASDCATRYAGALLAVPANAEENAAVAYLAGLAGMLTGKPIDNVWLGVFPQYANGAITGYTAQSSGGPIKWFNWAAGAPEHTTETPARARVYMDRRDGKWHSTPGNVSMAYVCEKSQ